MTSSNTDEVVESPPLRKVTFTPADFRTKARNCRWQQKSIDLFLKKPYCKSYVRIGDEGPGRVLAIVAEANNPA